ncbi:MAG: quinol:cytochrome C oxidoreductase [Bacteroidota bacterium]
MNYQVTNRAKIISLAFMVIGLIVIAAGFIVDDSSHHGRWWTNLFVNGLFFTFAGLGALYFVALQYATEAAWSVMARRIYEAIMSFVPYGLGVVMLVLVVGQFHGHHLFHWMDSGLYKEVIVEGTEGALYIEDVAFDGMDIADPHVLEYTMRDLIKGKTFVTPEGNTISVNPEYDHLIDGKSAFFHPAFFWLRQVAYVLTFIVFMRAFRKRSLKEDEEGGKSLHITNYKKGAVFLVFFAVFSSVLAWDWVMSIDTHWFSTMFGWYVFSGMWVSAMIAAVVMALYLKDKGLMPKFNNSHLHDMGKWMFAISFLWSYLWFCQFMLIWYSDIPEEVTYFVTRFENYPVVMWLIFAINFVLPMVILMSRDSKRNAKFLITIGTIIFVGHWLDVWLMVAPTGVSMADHSHLAAPGWMEVGFFIGFLGLFMRIVLNKLAEAPLVPTKSPYFDESIQHHI